MGKIIRHLEHKVVIDLSSLRTSTGYKVFKMEEWCNKNYGQRWNIVDNPEGRWTTFWAGPDTPRAYIWYFSEEKEAAWFALKWAG